MGKSRKAVGAPALVIGAALILGAAWLVLRGWPGSPGSTDPARTQSFTQVVHDVVFEEGLWETVSSGPGGAPEVGVLTPSMNSAEDGDDTPSLILPPPSQVRFTVPDDGGQVWLKGRTGVDLSAPGALPEHLPGVDIVLSVEVDGELLWSNSHVIRKVGGEPGTRLWKDLPEIALMPGQVVTLGSEILRPKDVVDAPRLAAGFGALELIKSGEKQLQSASTERPNIVLIVMDTLRQDRLSCYGYEKQTTPALDALAERGVLYENAYSSASWTWPSTASILTGLHPETHGVRDSRRCMLNQSLQTLPELLSGRKLMTGAITCNPLIVPNKNFDQGFDYFNSAHMFRRTELVMDAARDWLRLNADARFFLYVQFVDTHEKYNPVRGAQERAGGVKPDDFPKKGMFDYHRRLLDGEGHDEQGNSVIGEVIPPDHLQWISDSYDGAVVSADVFVGRLLDELESLGLADKTIVAFTSDHGEELGEHGLLTHGHTLYPEVVRVPLILAGPGLPQGERVDAPVSNRHLAPSLAALANAEFDVQQDALDLLRPSTIDTRPVYFSTEQGWWNGKFKLGIYGVRDGDWELHWAPTGGDWRAPTESKGTAAAPIHDPKGGVVRLFDLAQDPEQHVDVAEQQPAKAQALLGMLREHLARSQRSKPSLTVGAGKRSREALVGIGYIGEDEQDDEEQ